MKLLYDTFEKTEPRIDDFVLQEILPEEGRKHREEAQEGKDGLLQLKELHSAELESIEKQRKLEQKKLVIAQEQTEDMLRKSVRRSKEILDEAREQGDRLRQEAVEEGKKEGFQLGREEGRRQAYQEHEAALKKEIDSLKKEIALYVTEMEHAKELVVEKHLDDLKDISLAVAEKIMRISLKSSSEIIKRMILAATDKLKKTAWVKIYVGREEAGMELRGDRELLTQLAKISDNVKIVMMEEAEEGTCIIEMPNEIIDASIATQIENVKDILKNARL